MITRVLSPIAALLLFTAFALAQIPVNPDVSNDGFGFPSRRGAFGMNTRVSYSLSGVVTDFQGHRLGNANVTVQEMITGRVIGSISTQPDGSFHLADLPEGNYEVVATSGLYQAQRQVEISSAFAQVTLRLPVRPDNGGVSGGESVSVNQFQVPKKARKLFQEAQKAYAQQKRDEAIQRTEQALQQYPDFSEALALRAVLYLQDNQVDQARKFSEKAIKDDPTYGLSYIVLGTAYNMLTRFDDALRVLSRAFSFTPNSWQGYYESARAHLGKKEFRKALDDSDKAVQFAPKNFAPIYLLRANAFLGMKDTARAIASLQRYLKTDPKGPQASDAQKMLQQLQSQETTVAVE